jgi:hypothetical protein
MCKCAEGRLEVRRHGGVRLLKQLVLQEEPEREAGGQQRARVQLQLACCTPFDACQPCRPRAAAWPLSVTRPASPFHMAGFKGDWLVRYDKRDAAGCLLALRLSAGEVAEPPAISLPQLRRYKHCSHAWLLGRVMEPTEGYSESEVASDIPKLALGEAQDEEEGEWEADDATDDEDDAIAVQAPAAEQDAV